MVFDEISPSRSYSDVFEAIRFEILNKFEEFKTEFCFDIDSTNALVKLSKSDRKRFGVSKVLSRFKSQKAINELLKNGFLVLEKSREQKPSKKRKNERLPRNLRRYIVHDKVHLKSHFMRFYFRFVYPNLALLKLGKINEVLEIIRADFDNYASLGFELLSARLLKKWLKNEEIEIYSFWTKEFELDIFAEFSGEYVVGEVKYKERKVCKNLLNLAIIKSQKLGITPKFIALFSKSGFSKELKTMKNENLLLFEMADFMLLLE